MVDGGPFLARPFYSICCLHNHTTAQPSGSAARPDRGRRWSTDVCEPQMPPQSSRFARRKAAKRVGSPGSERLHDYLFYDLAQHSCIALRGMPFFLIELQRRLGFGWRRPHASGSDIALVVKRLTALSASLARGPLEGRMRMHNGITCFG